MKNWLFHIFPASEGSPFLTVILTVKLAGLPFLQAEEFTDNFQSDKSCQKYTFLLVLCFSGKSYLVIKVIKNVWLFTELVNFKSSADLGKQCRNQLWSAHSTNSDRESHSCPVSKPRHKCWKVRAEKHDWIGLDWIGWIGWIGLNGLDGLDRIGSFRGLRKQWCP